MNKNNSYYKNNFFQPDPVNGKTGMPLSFNLYSYGLGNPLKFYDPTGKMAKLPDVPYSILEIEGFFRGSPFANYSLEDLLNELESDEAVEKANQNQYKEGDIIYRKDAKIGAEDVARLDGRDASGRLLVMGYNKFTGKAELVPLGGDKDMFGSYEIVGVMTPEGNNVMSWQRATEKFVEKYQGKVLHPGAVKVPAAEYQSAKYKWECSELTTYSTYEKDYADYLLLKKYININYYSKNPAMRAIK